MVFLVETRRRNHGQLITIIKRPRKSELSDLQDSLKIHNPEWYASDFIKQLYLDSGIEQKCERTCLLWSKEHWANEAKKAQMSLQESKERALNSSDTSINGLFLNTQFLNTVAQVYGRMFGFENELCGEKDFEKCPYLTQRKDLLRIGSLASIFITILHKATMSAMLERHALDSGFIDDEYNDVYGIDLTNFQDLKASLQDGRFAILYDAVLKHAKQLAGIPWFTVESRAQIMRAP